MIAQLAKILIFFGFLLVLTGIILLSVEKVPYIGKLPGDIYIKKENFTLIAPLGTCFVISVFLSIIFYIIFRLLK